MSWFKRFKERLARPNTQPAPWEQMVSQVLSRVL